MTTPNTFDTLLAELDKIANSVADLERSFQSINNRLSRLEAKADTRESRKGGTDGR